jgi:hypothetical protein
MGPAPTKLTTRFFPGYYLDAYHLAKDGYTDRDIAIKLLPPVKFTAFIKWKRTDPMFRRSIEKGRAEREAEKNPITKLVNPNQMAFLMAYAQCGNITEAAKAAGLSYHCHVNWMRDPHRTKTTSYKDAFDMAHKMFCDTLVNEAVRRGRDGLKAYKFHQGKPVIMPCDKSHPEAREFEDSQGNIYYGYYYYEMRFSDCLLMKLLEAKVDGFKPDAPQVNVSQSMTMQDLLTQAEASRTKVIDATYVQRIAEATLGIEHQPESSTGPSE